MKLYHHPLSGHAHRARLFLSLIGLPYELVEVDLKAGAHKQPDFLKMNPFGQVPVLADGDVFISDSNAILVYLAKKAGQTEWLPEDAKGAAEVQRWLSVAAGEIAYGPAAARLVTVFGAKFNPEEVIGRAHIILGRIESQLQGREWLVSTFTGTKFAKLDESEIAANRNGTSNDPKAAAAVEFTRALTMARGSVAPAEIAKVRDAGYPGFGQSDAPDHTKFDYSFGHYADIVDTLLTKLGAAKYSMYVMDYGAPVGYRLALKHPDRVTGLIVQNGNAYDEGIRDFWNPIRAYWKSGAKKDREALSVLVAPETTKFQYTDGVKDLTRISPDNWVHDQALLDRAATRISSSTCSTTTARTCRFIRRSRLSSAIASRQC
jgi:glutathione S-transferase